MFLLSVNQVINIISTIVVLFLMVLFPIINHFRIKKIKSRVDRIENSFFYDRRDINDKK